MPLWWNRQTQRTCSISSDLDRGSTYIEHQKSVEGNLVPVRPRSAAPKKLNSEYKAISDMLQCTIQFKRLLYTIKLEQQELGVECNG